MRSASSFFVGAKKGKKEEERPNQGLRVARSQEEDYSLYRFEPLLRWGGTVFRACVRFSLSLCHNT